ncbi:hypothetical protein CLU97_0608 [Chryseobacterium sp. 7]|uniref:hypothetical protein n=1 Tax=Chryseobacterium sp. 7 TaxID=2035214 RepID=UPI000EAE0A1C|nr:hypothetical protein [Chryseobacterium sp. 7]RLJ31200.1 hypothetical protein CLU97_0608 [Chryseobacterium sp. 7]
MKNLFLLCSIFTFLSLFGQEKKVMNPPPPKNYKEIPENYNIDDNLVYFKIEKLSKSFNFAIFDNDILPVENTFIFSFIVEKDRNISNLKVEKGKNEKVINELKRQIVLAKFPNPDKDKISPQRLYKLKFIFDYKNKTLKTTLYDPETKGTIPSPLPEYPTESALDNKVYYIVDKKIEFNTNNLSSSFDFENLDENIPNDNIFIVSFIAEKMGKITDLNIEKGKDYKTIMELKRMLFRLRFHPALIKNKPVRSLCRLKFIFDYKNKLLKIIIL